MHFSILSILYQICIENKKIQTFEEYLRLLEHAQTDGQTNGMHKHFSTLLESVKNHGTQLKIYFQSFRSTVPNI